MRRAGIRNEALHEERQDLVACLDGRLAGRVDQVGRHNAVRARNALREEGRHIGVCSAVGEHAPDEAVANVAYLKQMLAQRSQWAKKGGKPYVPAPDAGT